MEKRDKYYTMGLYVTQCNHKYMDISVEYADMVRSEGLQIAADNDVSVRFKRRHKSGPRTGKTAVQLPKWVWDEAFGNLKS